MPTIVRGQTSFEEILTPDFNRQCAPSQCRLWRYVWAEPTTCDLKSQLGTETAASRPTQLVVPITVFYSRMYHVQERTREGRRRQ